jgi:hypothetical protein
MDGETMKKAKEQKRAEAELREAAKRSPADQLKWLDHNELRALKERKKLTDQ